MKSVRTHHDLDVWKYAMDLTVEIYRITDSFPAREKYGLVSQVRRAAVSIPSNIAEGAARNSVRQFRYFVVIALGSATELETQLELGCRLGFMQVDHPVINSLVRIRKMLISLKKSLDSRLSPDISPLPTPH